MSQDKQNAQKTEVPAEAASAEFSKLKKGSLIKNKKPTPTPEEIESEKQAKDE